MVKNSFSQLGEDMIILHFLRNKKPGYYVDIGAFHPEKYSNTKYLYDNGWKGINIDLSAGSIALFKQARPDDISIQCAISDRLGSVEVYEFDKIASVNTMDKSFADRWAEKRRIPYTTISVPANTLDNILEENTDFFDGMEFDFLNIDVEGAEESVLSGFSFRILPKVIALEIHHNEVVELLSNSNHKLLEANGYKLRGICVVTCIYVRE